MKERTEIINEQSFESGFTKEGKMKERTEIINE